VTSAPSDNVQSLTPAPALSLVKSASPAAPADFHAGEQITYSFVVTNTGNVTITGLAVVEGNFSGTGPLPDPICPAAATSLAPGTQTVCTSTYTVTQPDIDAGFITNTATATGTPPNGGPPVQTQASTARVPEPPHPAATLVKAVDVHTLTHAGQIVNYSFTVTNAGNTSLTRPTINESTFTGHGALTTPTCPASPTTLLPGQKIVCTASYTVVADDLTGQQLTNTATATTTPPGGSPLTSDPSTARVADVASTGPAHDPLAATGPTHLWNLTALGFALIVAGVGLRVRRRRTGK
jgi:LPXTG-motif cell wall-anchored protein